MSAKPRKRAIAKATAKIQRKDPSHKYEGAAIINDAGLKLTIEERDRFVALQKLAEAKRQETIEAFEPLPRKFEGEEVGGTVGELRTMGREVDFILSPKDKSWQTFKTKDQFDRYMHRLEVVTDPEYLENRARLYKRNFINSLLDVYGPQAMDIAMKIRMMKPMDYMKAVESDEALEIGFYAPSHDYVPGMLNKLRRALGMKEKDDWPEEERDE